MVLADILSIPCEEDGVTFDIETLRSEPITVDKKYPGTRFFITAHMDTIVYPMSLDLGFGDVVTPCPELVDFPLLLKDIPSINIKAYSLETVIAEKLHAMVDRDVANSRMKDFFDCYQILTTREFNDALLYDAIKATFDNRKLIFKPELQLFTEAFATDGSRIARWNTFIKNIHWKLTLEFFDVMSVLRDKLHPLYEKYWEEQDY